MNTHASVVVTGVSSGIGLGIAESLVAEGVRVFGSVRKREDANRLEQHFGARFVPLTFDVTDLSAVKAASRQVRDALGGEPLLGLVNNAGVGTAGPLLHVPLDEVRRQIEVNLIGSLSVIQQFAPLLCARTKSRAGRIVNIGSTAGRIGIPFMGAYSASKHAMEGLSESLRRELLLYGIDVITVVPGPVRTAIWDKAEALDLSAYSTTAYGKPLNAFLRYMVSAGRSGLEPKQVGSAVLAALTKTQPRPIYVVVPNKFKNWTLPKLLPIRVVDRLMGKQLGLMTS